MKRSLFAALLLVATACGSEPVGGPATTPVEGGGVTTTSITALPGATQRELLEEARLAWTANRPEAYEITYSLACECDGGPWFIRVEGAETVASGRVGPELGGDVPYDSIDAIFSEIEATIGQNEFPVDVEYDGDFGYPRSYIFNEPELPVDGGFILTVTAFEANPSPGEPGQRQAFADAVVRWENTGLLDYDYSFTRGCFCPEEFVGPYSVSVRAEEVAGASFRGTDLFDIDILEIGRYDEIIKTVPGVFAEIERALREADSFTAEYHPQLGYPTSVHIDWIANAADEEVNYTIANLRAPVEYPDTCSTEGWDVALLSQPDLPEPVGATRLAIFEAAMACDFPALVALSDAGDLPFETTFGGSGPEYFWEAELRGEPILQTLVEHLNLPFAAAEDGSGATYYAWPSAFIHLTSPHGDGIPAGEYEALLELYTVEDLEEMFETIGGYTGWRLIIAGDGEWLFFIAGD